MRISSILLLLFMSCAVTKNAQTQAASIKADHEATQAASNQADLPGDSSDNNQTTVPVIKTPVNLFADPKPVPVAKWDGGELTNVEVSATLALVRPSNIRVNSPEQFAYMPHDVQAETVKQLAYERILLKEARAAGIDEKTSTVASVLDKERDALLNRIYYVQQVQPKLEDLTQKAARDFYEENIDKLFTKPALSSVRDVHISTYEMITAEKGDTLESLAKQVSGDPDQAKNIRDAESPYFMRATEPELADKVLTSPLTGGEVLFVPKNQDAIASATVLAKKLREQLLSGKSIDDVLLETSSDEFPVSATKAMVYSADSPLYPEILSAIQSIQQTTISEVVKTPAGLDILVLADHQTTEVVPYKDVKSKILENISEDENQQRTVIEKTRNETLDRLWKKFHLKTNDEALARPNYAAPDPLSSDTVIVSAENLKYTLADYLQDLRLTGKDWGQLTHSERLDVLNVSPTLTNYVVTREARELGLENDPNYQKMLSALADSEIVAEYKKRLVNPQDHRVSEDELRAYYNDHIDNYTSPSQVTIRELSKRINLTLPPEQKAEEITKAKKELEEIRSRIHSQEDFAQLARRESQAISTRSRGGLIGTVSSDFRGEAFKNQLRHLKVGEVSEPFLYGSEVMIVRLDDQVAPTVQPFEQVKRQVMRDYARTVPPKKRDSQRQQTLDKAHFKLLF